MSYKLIPTRQKLELQRFNPVTSPNQLQLNKTSALKNINEESVVINSIYRESFKKRSSFLLRTQQLIHQQRMKSLYKQ
jgi:hypothetical protein